MLLVALPKTGIEYIYSKERPRFKEEHREFEPVHCMNVSIIILNLI